MYKILLIDDEPRQLKALANVLQNLRPEYEIMLAGDGREAYNELQNNKVDILITDIKMPNMDGLELLEKLDNRRNEMKIVIISGFAEFAYAQKAIALGVNNYLVKPIRKVDLEKMLNTIERTISDERIKQEKEESLQKRLDDSLPVYLEHQLNKWIKGTIEQRGIEEIASIFPFKGKGVILVTALKGIPVLQEKEIHQDAKFSMKEMLNVIGHSISFFLEGHSSIMVTIVNTHQKFNMSSQEHERRLLYYLDHMRNEYEISGTIGVSEQTEHIFENISKCFEQAQSALERKFYQSTDKIIHSKNLENQVLVKAWNTDALEKELTEAIARLDHNLCVQLTSQILKDQFPIMEPQDLKEIITHLTLNLAKTLRNVMTDEDYSTFKESIKTKVNESNDQKELWHRMNAILHDIIDMLCTQRKDINAVILQKCQKYIEEHYMEEISLEMVAQKYHFNNAYFSNLFKEYVGVSFSKYLTKIRLENAQKLLVTTSYSMSDISQRVGISDPAYFNRIFKRELGVAPNKYRQMNSQA